MPNQKVLIVGGVAGGASTAARLRRLDENAEITIFERGDYISFANCGLPYYIGNVIENREELLVMSPELMEKRFRIKVKVHNEVLSIHREQKYIVVRDNDQDSVTQYQYDKLVLATGSEPFVPPVSGADAEGVFTLWNMRDTDQIKQYLHKKSPKSAVVVGGGFIGLEMVENLRNLGIKVTLVEMQHQVMPNMDFDMAQILHKMLVDHGVSMMLGETLTAIEKQEEDFLVKLQSGKEVRADLVIMAVGVRPNSSLAQKAGLALNARKGILVDDHLRTNDSDIYALGDAIEVVHYITGEKTMIPLAGPANKQGRICADNLAGLDSRYMGTMGASIVKLFELAAGSVGLNEKQLKAQGKRYKEHYFVSKIHALSNAGYYPDGRRITLKLLYAPDGCILGAQAIGEKGVDKRLDVLAAAIHFHGTIYDLKDLELCYAPPFSSAKDPVNMLGFTAENQLRGICDFITWDAQMLKERKDLILLDVRTAEETAAGMVENAVHIPVDELRQRLEELDKTKTIAVYCAVGLRGYVACRILQQNGFRAVDISGGYVSYSQEC